MSKLAIYFKVFPDGDVIALMPSEIADPRGNITSYMRIGQHGAASPELMKEFRDATEEERANLLKELVAIYKPRRVTRSGVPGDAVLFHEVPNE